MRVPRGVHTGDTVQRPACRGSRAGGGEAVPPVRPRSGACGRPWSSEGAGGARAACLGSGRARAIPKARNRAPLLGGRGSRPLLLTVLRLGSELPCGRAGLSQAGPRCLPTASWKGLSRSTRVLRPNRFSSRRQSDWIRAYPTDLLLLSHLCKDPVFKHSHILRSWGLGLRLVGSEGHDSTGQH